MIRTGNPCPVGPQYPGRGVVGTFDTLETPGDLLIAQFHMDGFGVDVDGDDVPVPDGRDGAAVPCLGGDVADAGAAGGAGVAAVGDHGDAGVQPHSHQHGGGDGHLTHAGTALRALVPDDQHAAGDNLAVDHLIPEGLLRVKADGGAGVAEHGGLHAALFDQTAAGGDVAVEDGVAAVGIEGVLLGMDDI